MKKNRFFENLKIFDFFEKIEKSRKIKILGNFQIFEKIWKFSIFFHIFSIFLMIFFMNFNQFWCSGKLKCSSFQKVPYLFTKYALLALCMAVSEKPVKKIVFHVKSSLLGIEVTKFALDLPDQCSASSRHQFWSMLRFFADIRIFLLAQMDLGEVYCGTWHAR